MTSLLFLLAQSEPLRLVTGEEAPLEAPAAVAPLVPWWTWPVLAGLVAGAIVLVAWRAWLVHKRPAQMAAIALARRLKLTRGQWSTLEGLATPGVSRLDLLVNPKALAEAASKKPVAQVAELCRVLGAVAPAEPSRPTVARRIDRRA